MAKITEVVAGARFGRLVVVSVLKEYEAHRGRNIKYVQTTCDCGTSFKTRLDGLGVATFSCGCLNLELTKQKGLDNKTHGLSKTGTYKSWAEMWARCTNPNHHKYHLYKNRTPPEAWRDFEVFLADMGLRPDGFSIERVNNDLPYGPVNCVWLPMAEQGKNTSRVNFVLFEGKRYTVADASRALGLSPKTVRTRLNGQGWPIEKALGEGWSWFDSARGAAVEAKGAAYQRPDRVK